MKKYLILYIPAIHQGYIQLLKKYTDTHQLLIIGDDIIANFPEDKREIRAISPKQAQDIIEGLGWFKDIKIISEFDLNNLPENSSLVFADEYMSHTLAEKLSLDKKHSIEFSEIFLRYDQSKIGLKDIVNYDTQISANDFDKTVMQSAQAESQKSPDWFLKVGAALVQNNRILILVHNQRTPTPQAKWMEGDPRNYMKLGTNPHLHKGLHAEQTVIAQAAKLGITTSNCNLYITTFPCPTCAALIAYAGIKKVYFASGHTQLESQEILKKHMVEIIWVDLGNKKAPAKAEATKVQKI
ncbi:hypothetical protein KJ836_01395 [Patescibacteria group bacterium]|nr:hypothetical protein [Patescibacteria group bacterium]